MSKCKCNGVVLFAVLTALIIAFIWHNSCMSGEESGAQSGAVTEFLQSILDPDGKIPTDRFHHFVRKTAHFVEFALLGALTAGLFWRLRRQTGRAFFSLPVLMVLLVAVLDEYIQNFTGRGSAVTDVMLDFSGGLTGLGLVALGSAMSSSMKRKIKTADK